MLSWPATYCNVKGSVCSPASVREVCLRPCSPASGWVEILPRRSPIWVSSTQGPRGRAGSPGWVKTCAHREAAISFSSTSFMAGSIASSRRLARRFRPRLMRSEPTMLSSTGSRWRCTQSFIRCSISPRQIPRWRARIEAERSGAARHGIEGRGPPRRIRAKDRARL